MENVMTSTTEVPKTKKPFHLQVAEQLIEQLKQGTAPWQKPWTPGVDPTPVNPVTGKNYRGVNDLWLRMANQPDPRWMTYNQANKEGYTIKKGSRGMPVQYWVWEEKRNKLDKNGNPVLNKDGNPEKITVQLDRPKVMYYTVFNASQIEGIPDLPEQELKWNPIERAESMVKSLNFSKVINDTMDRAYYWPALDEIHMPDRASFDNAESYYDTLLHEAAHGTGHKSRLDRDMTGAFGTEQYAREELRAEIASMMINSQIGLAHDSSNSAAYVNSWVKHLENHPMEILRAAADADKIREYVFERERELEHIDVREFAIEALAYDRHGVCFDYEENIMSPKDLHGGGWSEYQVRKVEESGTRFTVGTFKDVDDAFRYREILSKMPSLEFSPECAGKFEVRGVVFDDANESVDSYPIDNVTEEQIAKYSTFGVYTRLNDDTQEHMADFENYKFAAEYAWAATRKFVMDIEQQQAIEQKTEINTAEIEIPANCIGEFHVDGVIHKPNGINVYHPISDKQNTDLSEFAEFGVTTALTTGAMMTMKIFANYDDAQTYADLAKIQYKSLPPVQVNIPVGSTGTFDIRGCIYDTESGTTSNYSLDNLQQADLEKFHSFGVYTTLDDGAHYRMQHFEYLADAQTYAKIADQQYMATMQELTTNELKERPLETGHRSNYNNDDPSARTYINVPKREKNEAKSLGAKWDHPKLSWYIPGDVGKQPFAKWMGLEQTVSQQQAQAHEEREYLAVPYKEKNEARKAGARWDGMEKSWYVLKDNTEALARCEKWRCRDNKPDRCATEPALSPEEEFRAALVHMGAREKSLENHPIADGKFHRLEEQNDINGGKSMSYKFYADGRPAGFIQNNRSGEKVTWKAKGHTLNENAKAEIRKEAGKKLEQRAKVENEERDQTIAVLAGMLAKLAGKEPNKTPYMEAKGVEPHAGTYRMGPSDNVLVVPSYNTAGNLQSVQYVQADGEKRFASKTTKTGSFHVIGHGTSDALKDTRAIVIAEGYATAATITEATGIPTVSAFDSGNLLHVAKALREQYPDKPIIIAADDDKHLETGPNPKNPGRDKAIQAAEMVNGTVVLPCFTPEQRNQAMLANLRITDFNDLAQMNSEGKESVRRQINHAIEINSQLVKKQNSIRTMEHTAGVSRT